MSYCTRSFGNLEQYQTLIKKNINLVLKEDEIKDILVSCGYSAFPKPQSLIGDWKPIASMSYPAVQYVNTEEPGFYEWVTVIPHNHYGLKPHILHYSSGSESLVSNEQLEFYLWFQNEYPALQKIKMEVDLKDNKHVAGLLFERYKENSLSLIQITFLNTYFGNTSIFKQVMKDIGLCFKCFKPGLPNSGLGISRIFNYFSIRHMQKKEWSKDETQKVDYVIINDSGKFVTLNKDAQIGVTINRKDPDAHIPLEKYNRSELLLGKSEKCKCMNQI